MKFKEWFAEQFGDRPMSIQEEDAAVLDVKTGNEAKEKLDKLYRWERERAAALCAWQAHAKVGEK